MNFIDALSLAFGIVLVGFLFRIGWVICETVEIWIFDDRKDEKPESPA